MHYSNQVTARLLMCVECLRGRNPACISSTAALVFLSVCLWTPCVSAQAATHADEGLQLAQSGNLVGAESELRKAAALAPGNPEYLADLATVLAMENKLEESSVFFKRALKEDPSNLSARRYLAANLWQLHRYPEAKENLEILLKQKSDDNEARLLLGMVAQNMKDYATAARMLSAVPNEVLRQPESIAALGDSYYHLGEKEKARSALQELQKYPTGEQGVVLAAQIADENADYEAAEAMLKSVGTARPDLAYRLALIEYHAGEFERSEEMLVQLIASGTKTGNVFNLLGWCYQKQSQTEPALHAFENGIGAAPSDESNYLDLQKVLLVDNRLAAALEVSKKTTAALPNSARAFAMRGSIETQSSLFSNAVESYRRARELDPQSADAVLGFADSEFAADQKKEARTDFEAGMKRFPKDARFPLHYADCLLKDAETGDSTAEARAEALLQLAARLDPSSAQAPSELGDVALKRGNISEALQDFSSAAKLDPQNAKAHFGLSRVYRRLGKTEEAAREAKLFQQLQAANSSSAARPSGASPNR